MAGYLSVRKAFALAPCDVFGNGATLLLGKARHDGDQQFAFAVEGVDTLLFKIDLGAVLLQLADGGEAVHGISGKAVDGFRDDQVDPPGHRIRNHAVKAVPVTGVRCGYAFVRVHVHELPIRIRANEFGVIIHLRLIGGELLLTIGGNTSVPCYSTSAPGIDRHFGMERFRCRNYSDISRCACYFLSLFALRPLSSPVSSFRPVTDPASV